MAECSYARCVQQRRNVRRLLQRWTKNMVHIVGLERIAEELMGRRKWKLYQDSMSRSYLQPLNNNVARATSPPAGDAHKAGKLAEEEAAAAAAATPDDGGRDGDPAGVGHQKENEAAAEEVDRAGDWQPQAKCHFCVDGKMDSEHAVHGVLSPRQSDSDSSDSQSDGEAPASLTAAAAAAVGNGRAHPRPRMAALDDVAALAVAALSGGGGTAAAAAAAAAAAGSPHLGFYPPGVSSWYLANVARSFQTAAAAEADKAGGEQPLDLSKGSSNSSSNSEPKISVGNNLNVRLPLDARSIFSSDFRAKPRMSAMAGRRTYTEDELQAALRDIQSGKLGTRRAAVIYGIPRSTLRNKVYKLTMERERETHLNSSGLKLDDDDPMDDDKDLSGAEEEKEVEKVLQAPLLSVADILRIPTEHPSEMLRNLMQLRAKEGQDIWTGLDHSEVGPYIQALLASQTFLANQKPEGVVNNIIPELAKRIMTEEQQLRTQNNGDNERLSRPSPSNSVITKVEKARSESDMETDESPSNVILKIPSFKPTTSSSKNGCDIFRNVVEPSRLVSPPVTTNTSDSSSPPILPGKGLLIKDAIAQSISQKFQQTMEPTRRPIMELDLKRGGFTPPLGAGMSVIKTQQAPEVTRPQYQPPPKQPQGGSGTTGGKGTRPKRGKYRNYDRDSLVEAVRAVQRGEMSVHRAGSYYGVPHSTLEYKVKERHLMRPRKRDPKPNPVDEKIASLKQNDLRVAAAQQDKMKPNIMKPPQKFSPTSPNGMKLPIFEPGMASLAGYNPAPFPFWPHPGFHHLQMEYAARNPAAPFPPNHEFFASQMMQKIQEDSSRAITPQGVTPNTATLAKNARQMAESLLDGTGANSSFLDGIIRSSLESGIPPSEEKSPREDKNLTPENMSNKVLLDQLCRNSRLTPLSKPPPTPDPNSSGDESYRKGSSPLNFTTGNNSHYQDEPDKSAGGRLQKDVKSNDLQTIELTNDSNDTKKKVHVDVHERNHPRIYLKPDLVKPENLKPEMLVRFQGVNGATECTTGSSASDNDAPQD